MLARRSFWMSEPEIHTRMEKRKQHMGESSPYQVKGMVQDILDNVWNRFLENGRKEYLVTIDDEQDWVPDRLERGCGVNTILTCRAKQQQQCLC